MTRTRFFEGAARVALLIAGLAIYGALPGITAPTVGQAIWTAGFAQSFANGPLPSVFAHNFGYPSPAAMAFGLAGGVPASWFLRLGLSPADGYTLMVAGWLTVAFASASMLARRLGAGPFLRGLAALMWLALPIVWAHADYSMVGLGIALLPFYFLPLVEGLDGTGWYALPACVGVAIVAIFMDGYTFVMYATGGSILLAGAFLRSPRRRRRISIGMMPSFLIGLLIAYAAYRGYAAYDSFDTVSQDVFRGWGVDLSFLVLPTTGSQWVPDLLGWSVVRTDASFYGDASVWETTFAAPLLVVAAYGGWRAAKFGRPWLPFALVGLFGMFFALGPSVKIDSRKPQESHYSRSNPDAALMPRDAAVFPTGSGWISEHAPGFKFMRASYRWESLGLFGFWSLAVLGLCAPGSMRQRYAAGAIFFTIVVISVPDLAVSLHRQRLNRQSIYSIDRDFVRPMRSSISPGDVVAFAPFGNDFLAAFAAARLDVRAYNAGGDKNFVAAFPHWPLPMTRLTDVNSPQGQQDVRELLVSGEASIVFIPYVDMLYAAHLWPCARQSDPAYVSYAQKFPAFDCPRAWRGRDSKAVSEFAREKYLSVLDTPWFAAVRLRPGLDATHNAEGVVDAVAQATSYPLIPVAGDPWMSAVFGRGWHAPESQAIWSSQEALLRVGRPDECSEAPCDAVLTFSVYGASSAKPMDVQFEQMGISSPRKISLHVADPALHRVALPVVSSQDATHWVVRVPAAVSPESLTGGSDSRVLGISVRSIELKKGSGEAK